jgi:hypothetical protein
VGRVERECCGDGSEFQSQKGFAALTLQGMDAICYVTMVRLSSLGLGSVLPHSTHSL